MYNQKAEFKLEKSAEYIFIDGQGQWWYEGNKIIHPEVLALFKSSLTVDESGGGLFIDYKGKRAPVRVEETPFFVHDVIVEKDCDDGLSKIFLELDDGTREGLDPESLRLDARGVLQVRVKEGRFAARCLPAAHFRLAELLVENDDGGLSLVVGGKSYPLGKM